MSGHVRLVGRELVCDVCAHKRVMGPGMTESEHIQSGYLYLTRREQWEREHAHGAPLKALPRHYRFPKVAP